MPRSSKSFGGSMRDSASAMKEVIATAKELYDSISDDESKTQEYQNTIDNLNDDISRLNAEIFALERRIKASGDIELFENLKQQAATASYQFTQFAETLGLSLNSVADDGKTTIDTISKNIKKGETTYLQAVQNVKGGFTKLLREQQSVDFDASMVQRFTSAFDELAKSVKALTQKIIELVESTPKALEGLNNIDGDDASVSVKKIADATKELTVGAAEAYEPLTNLVTALTELGKVDEYSLSNISAIFRNLSSVGEGTFGDQKIKQLKQLISVVQEATGNSTGRLSIDLSGLDGLKGLDKRNVEKITNVGEAIKGISALLGDSSTLSSNVDQIIKLFQVDPSSGINNLKVSKASLSNLQTFLPEIAKVKIDNIQKLFSIDTSGINSLKVSKPSIQNVVNLARAAQILKENNVDLTLKGDPSEELNKIAQKMSLVGDAAGTAADAVNDLSGALGSRDLEPTEPEGYSPLNGKDLAGSVKSALRLQEVPAENIKEVTKAVAGMRGEFVSATAAWRDYGKEGRHVTSVVVQTATEAENGIQKLTSQVVEFKRNVNEETGEVTWTSKLASGIEKIKAVADSAAQSTDKLIKQNDALSLAKLDDLRLNAERSIQSALRSGVGDDNDSIDALRTLQSVLGDVESELRNADYSQSAFNEITKEASALIGVHSKQLGFAVQQQKEEAAATREAEKAKAALVDRTKAQAAVEAELNKVIGPLYGDAIKNGISESDPGMQQLKAYASELYALYDWMQNDANMTQTEFEEHLKNIKAYYSSTTTAVKQNIATVKEAAKAEKEMNTNLASSAKTRESIIAATEKYKRAEASLSDAARKSYASFDTLTKKLAELEGKYKRGDISADEFKKGVADVNAELRANTRTLDNTGYGVDGLSMKFGRLAQELGRFLSPLLLARQAWQTLKQMANVVIELEDAFAQLQIVTGATDKELEEFYSTASDIANNLGKSITDIAKSIEVFSRLGYSLPDATVLAEYATVLSNVANVTTDQATTGLTAIIKGYNMHVEDAEHVSDVLVSIGQKYAVSAGEMMEAYEKAGAALAATNTSFDKSAALIAAANSAVQNSSIVGKVLPMHAVMYV